MAAAVAVAAIALAASGRASSPKFFDDDPIWVERDTQDASGMKPVETSLFVDVTSNALKRVPAQAPVRAQNLNSVDEVPDSSWFTNRTGRRFLTSEEIEAGPNTSRGLAPGPWTVTSSKTDFDSWETPVDAYFRLRGGQWRLVGFERMPEGDK